MSTFPYFWRLNYSAMRPIARKGQLCRVLVRASMNSALIEFEDGYRVVASRNSIRRAARAVQGDSAAKESER